MQLDPSKALFVFVHNTLPQTGKKHHPICKDFTSFPKLPSTLFVTAASRMDSLYNTFKEEDGFLYMCYSTEKTFG